MKNNAIENNRIVIAQAIYKDLLEMAENVLFGSIGCNMTIHNGLIAKVEFSEQRKFITDLRETKENGSKINL